MSLKELFEDLNSEIEEEAIASLSIEDQRLHEVAQRLLRVERDLKVPGAASSDGARVDRLLEEISKERF